MSAIACQPYVEETATPASLQQWHTETLGPRAVDSTPVDYLSSATLCYLPPALGDNLAAFLPDWSTTTLGTTHAGTIQLFTYDAVMRNASAFTIDPDLAPYIKRATSAVTSFGRETRIVRPAIGLYRAIRPITSPASASDMPTTPALSSRTTAPDPLSAAVELKSFLGLSWDQLSEITDVNRGTYLYWQRSGGHPRPTTLRKLMRVYSLAFTVARELGDMPAVAWFRQGSPSPLDLMSSGDLAAAEQAARQSLPKAAPPRRALLGRVDPRDTEGVGD